VDMKEFGDDCFSVIISRIFNRKLYLTFSIAMIFAISVTVPLYKSSHPRLAEGR